MSLKNLAGNPKKIVFNANILNSVPTELVHSIESLWLDPNVIKLRGKRKK